MSTSSSARLPVEPKVHVIRSVARFSYIQRTAAECIEEITEIPTTPPPRLQERTVVEPAGPPQVVKRVVRVPPRGNYGPAQQPNPPAGCGGAPELQGAGSYGNIQQASNGSLQPSGASYSGGDYGGASSSVSYGSASGAYSPGAADFSSASASYGTGPANFAGASGNYAAPSGGYQAPPQPQYQPQVQYQPTPQPQPQYQAPPQPQYQPQAPAQPRALPPQAICFTVGGDGRSQPMPPAGCNPAFCFYV